MDGIIDLINQCGFPIFVSVALMYMNAKQEDRHAASEKEMRDVIDRNTEAVTVLTERLRGDDK